MKIKMLVFKQIEKMEVAAISVFTIDVSVNC